MKYLKLIALLLYILNLNCFYIKDLTKTENITCEVHNVPMKNNLKFIRYGLILQHSQFNLFNVRKEYFPNSKKRPCLGGCVVGKEKFVKRLECDICTEVEKKWTKRLKYSYKINNVNEILFSTGSYNQGMQYLIEQNYIRAIMAFHYTLTTFPNFHLNDKSNYWLMKMFLKFGEIDLAKGYYINAVEFNFNSGNCGNMGEALKRKILDSLSGHFDSIVKSISLNRSNSQLVNRFHSNLDKLISTLIMPDTAEPKNVLNEFEEINAIRVNEINDNSFLYDELVLKTCESFKNSKVSFEQ